MYYYFFDTNFLRDVSRTENEEYVNWILKLLFNPANGTVAAVMTHFSKFEALGLTVPTFNYHIPSSDVHRDKLPKVLQDIQLAAEDHLRTCDNLKPDYILQRVEELRKRTHPKFLNTVLFKVHFELSKRDVDSYREELIERLVKNISHTFQYPKQVKKYVHHIGYGVFFKHLAEGENASFLRLLKPIWDSTNKSVLDKRFSPSQQKDFSKAMSFKLHADLVDSELLHYALFGFTDQNGKRHPVHCFTSDMYSSRLLNRLRIFKSLSTSIIRREQKEGKDVSFTKDFREGFILKLDPNPAERTMIGVRYVKPLV